MGKKKQNWVTQKELMEIRQLNNIEVVCNWVKRGLVDTKVVFGKTVVDANSVRVRATGRPKKNGVTVKKMSKNV